MTAAIDHVRKKHFEGVSPNNICLYTTDSQLAAIHIYEKSGFQLLDKSAAQVGAFPYWGCTHGMKVLYYYATIG